MGDKIQTIYELLNKFILEKKQYFDLLEKLERLYFNCRGVVRLKTTLS